MNRPVSSHLSDRAAGSLLEGVLGAVAEAQNSDGGWAFAKGGDSRVEPTCWALLGLANTGFAQSGMAHGLDFLKSQQRPDGSWPTTNGMSSGGWVTSLGALTLAQFPANEKSVHAALEWLSDDYPRDSSRWQKFLKSLSAAKQHASHNDEFRGWGWTPRTSSWVEPTAFALLAFAAVSAKAAEASAGFSASGQASLPIAPQLAKQMSDRRPLAIGLLYDRMCSGGGWNCGNPRVYGVDGDSLILPTCWALLALGDTPDHPNRAASLAWLEKSFAAIASPGSLAVAQITLESYNLPVPLARRPLADFSPADLAGQGTHVAAWTALALNPSRVWPARFSESRATTRQAQT
jgi:hypothetical protein